MPSAGLPITERPETPLSAVVFLPFAPSAPLLSHPGIACAHFMQFGQIELPNDFMIASPRARIAHERIVRIVGQSGGINK